MLPTLRSVAIKPRTIQPRLLTPPARRRESSYQPPTPPDEQRSSSNRHRDFYRTFGRPLAKNFLIAVATYQILYFSWLKLESFEAKSDGEAEVKRVEGELRELVAGKEKEG